MINRWLWFFVFLLIPKISISCVADASASTTPHPIQKAPASSVPSVNKQLVTTTPPVKNTVTDNISLANMECYHVANGVNENTVVCAMKPPATIWISAIFSALALLISFGGLIYGLRKDRKLRLQSVEDDFWIRKVISPIALEPLIKKITETVSNIPADCSSSGFDKNVCNEFGTNFQSEWNQLRSSMDALALLNKDLCKTTMTHISNIEDEVLRYCSNNAAGKVGLEGGCINKSDLQEKINAEMLEVMNCIKQYQISKI